MGTKAKSDNDATEHCTHTHVLHDYIWIHEYIYTNAEGKKTKAWMERTLVFVYAIGVFFGESKNE